MRMWRTGRGSRKVDRAAHGESMQQKAGVTGVEANEFVMVMVFDNT